ncbi:MAG: asparagine synthase (glutamine-hydrolyzing) [Planctomycetaceae bacterium]
MCGIAGVVGGDPRARPAQVDRMLRLLRHRGPDGEGAVEGGAARLGCARLAIRGGAAGQQPLRTARGLLVFNGEIANVDELVKDLAWHGRSVGGESDTAVVGALLDVYGPAAVDRLNGMYALAWDDGRQIWLARDPAGIKPLYYRLDKEGARFASEILPLLDADRALHDAAVARWLRFHWAYGTETWFRGVLRVPPGGLVALPEGRIARAGDPVLEFGAPNPSLTPERFGKVLRRAVADATPSGRFGVTLSGGVDSALVAALAGGASAAYHGRVDAPGCDESPYARAAAAELRVPLVEIPITAQACLDAFPRLVRAMEEPAAGPGALGQWLVCERASRDVKVLLTGCGGDELFGGYARAAALLLDEPPAPLAGYAALFARVRGLPPAERALALLDRRQPALFRPEFLAAHPAPDQEFLDAFAAGGLPPETAAARMEARITLPALLHVEDRTSMAFGLEGRVPLCDRRLLRCATRLPAGARVDEGGRLKAFFRRAADPLLPSSVRARSDKMGFPLPLGDWFEGPWGPFARDLLLDARTKARGMVDPKGVESALARGGQYDRGLYAVCFLEIWCRTFLDAP